MLSSMFRLMEVYLADFCIPEWIDAKKRNVDNCNKARLTDGAERFIPSSLTPDLETGVKSRTPGGWKMINVSRKLFASAMRLFGRVSRPIVSLSEVQAVLKYFEKYGRVQEFSIRRVISHCLQSSSNVQDPYSRLRERSIHLTYADASCSQGCTSTSPA